MNQAKMYVGALLGAMAVLIACSGGKEGDPCSNEGDCDSNLTCQPIENRSERFCCPTPPETSHYNNCKPAPSPADAGATSTPTPAEDAGSSDQ